MLLLSHDTIIIVIVVVIIIQSWMRFEIIAVRFTLTNSSACLVCFDYPIRAAKILVQVPDEGDKSDQLVPHEVALGLLVLSPTDVLERGVSLWWVCRNYKENAIVNGIK